MTTMKRIVPDGTVKRLAIGLLAFCLSLTVADRLNAQPALTKQILALTDQEYNSLENLYKHLHAHPELSLQEKETAALLTQTLAPTGCQITTGVGGHGIVGIMKNGPGPVVMIRTDMDALPLKENTGVGFASNKVARLESDKESPLMHACGHDMHMAVWIGVARVLAKLKKEWSGTVVFVGQPAEEKGLGATAMLADGLFKKFPRPDYALALHVNSALESAKVGICSGYVLANIDVLDIVVKGKGGHGSVPQLTIDPIVMASKMILGFQTIVSREISPQTPALITVGSVHGGTNDNIIPDEVKLELSIRSFDDEVQKAVIEKVRRTCEGIAHASGVEKQNYPVVTIRKGHTPAVYNDPALAKKMTENFVKLLGEDKVVSLSAEMFGEDFGWYGRETPAIPTLIYSLGSVNPGKMADAKKTGQTIPSTHSSMYLPDYPPTLRTGVISMSSAALSLLKK
ncbi:N-acetyldiaminopimelate deacetylase [Dyadobacter sp. CECT 9275]|uniref:N-acetyldiaminopimelate deacetylase n=1 Tax=Dyadobacter helix TaxID=2822344 RepID=A0A916N4J0_9BACT|nr:amidohydrolase [Dyadobacter sp. CECT 9275]CAG5000882.1 N-acetyldiaminopimelate deacetylase [Dyadobacter sp. CECT 9275]